MNHLSNNCRNFQGTLANIASFFQNKCRALLSQVDHIRAETLIYARILFTICMDEYTHSREIATIRSTNCLHLARISLNTCPGNALAKIRSDLADVLADLHRLRLDTSDDDLYDLVRTKLNDLKFQFGCAIRLMGTEILDSSHRQAIEERLTEANAAFAA